MKADSRIFPIDHFARRSLAHVLFTRKSIISPVFS